jgi:GR25 family glycosyltransferase involved in LPS biosynthesis
MLYDIIIAISLERRKDRRTRLESHLSERGFKDVYYLPAYDGEKITPGIVSVIPPHRSYFSFKDELSRIPTNKMNRFQIACTMSHIGALKFAKMLNAKTAFIVEDDVEFPENIQEVFINIENESKNLDWEHIYLGGAVRNFVYKKMEKVTEHLYTTSFTDGLHAYLVRGNGFNKISDAMLSFKTTNDDSMNDIMFREVDPLRAYMYLPKTAFQITDFSELDRRVIDRQDLRKS